MSQTDVVVMKRRTDAVAGEMRAMKDGPEDGMMTKREEVGDGTMTMSVVTAQDPMKKETANLDHEE